MQSNTKVSTTIFAAIGIGIAAGAVAWGLFPFTHGADFMQFHYHARNWLDGNDPYVGGVPIMRATRMVPEPFFYPFPTLLAVAPFATLPLAPALVLFVACSATILAYAVLRTSAHRLPALLGAGFLVAVVIGQWSPLILATLLLPSLAWTAVLKPNIGLAATLAKPTWIGIIGGAVLLLGTLVIQPTWPRQWLENLHSMPRHPAPIFLPGGFLILVAALRWRRPEARLLVTMACVPQLMYFADQLPLWLVPQTRRESMLLTTTSLLAWAATLLINIPAGRSPAFSSEPFVLISVYLPAVIMVLRRANEGEIHPVMERLVAHAPAWLRGRSAVAA
jgi:hypothetical protein